MGNDAPLRVLVSTRAGPGKRLCAATQQGQAEAGLPMPGRVPQDSTGKPSTACPCHRPQSEFRPPSGRKKEVIDSERVGPRPPGVENPRQPSFASRAEEGTRRKSVGHGPIRYNLPGIRTQVVSRPADQLDSTSAMGDGRSGQQ